MGILCYPQVDGTVLYNDGMEVARIDNDGDLAVTCPEDGYKVHIPLKLIIQMIGNVKIRNAA